MNQIRQVRRAAARATTAASTVQSGRPVPPKSRAIHEKVVKYTATDVAWKNANGRILGHTRANHGRSHKSYCGEYTLVVSRNTMRSGNASVQRARSGARRIAHRSARTEPARNATSGRILAKSGFVHDPKPLQNTNQTVPSLTPRS